MRAAGIEGDAEQFDVLGRHHATFVNANAGGEKGIGPGGVEIIKGIPGGVPSADHSHRVAGGGWRHDRACEAAQRPRRRLLPRGSERPDCTSGCPIRRPAGAHRHIRGGACVPRRRGRRQQAGAKVARADCIEFLQHNFSAGVEPLGRQTERERKHECQQAERRPAIAPTGASFSASEPCRR